MTITLEILRAYLEDGLGEAETAEIERELRASDVLRDQLRQLLRDEDRGEHSLGAIWRRHRLTCPGREQLGSYLLDAMDPALSRYIRFHLETVGCPYCQANLADLKDKDRDAAPAKAKRQRIFDSSAGLLKRKRK
jgi:hypothetical protein